MKSKSNEGKTNYIEQKDMLETSAYFSVVVSTAKAYN